MYFILLRILMKLIVNAPCKDFIYIINWFFCCYYNANDDRFRNYKFEWSLLSSELFCTIYFTALSNESMSASLVSTGGKGCGSFLLKKGEVVGIKVERIDYDVLFIVDLGT